MPKGRTVKYMVWRSCERFNLTPPGVKNNYDNNTAWQVAQLLAYENIRENEEAEQWLGPKL